MRTLCGFRTVTVILWDRLCLLDIASLRVLIEAGAPTFATLPRTSAHSNVGLGFTL